MEQLIESVRKYKCLYDISSEEYRNVDRKELAWQEIAVLLKQDCNEIKKEWKLLRDSYRNAMNRRKTKSGQGAKNAKPWKYEEQMSFLLPYTVGKPSHSNISQPETDLDTEFQDPGSVPQLRPTTSANTTNFESEVHVAEDEGGQSSRSTTPQLIRQKRKSSSDSDRVIEYLKSKNERKKPAGDLEFFFASACESTRRLPKLKQIQVKRKIMDIIATAEEEVAYQETPNTSASDDTLFETNDGIYNMGSVFFNM